VIEEFVHKGGIAGEDDRGKRFGVEVGLKEGVQVREDLKSHEMGLIDNEHGGFFTEGYLGECSHCPPETNPPTSAASFSTRRIPTMSYKHFFGFQKEPFAQDIRVTDLFPLSSLGGVSKSDRIPPRWETR